MLTLCATLFKIRSAPRRWQRPKQAPFVCPGAPTTRIVPSDASNRPITVFTARCSDVDYS